MQMFTLRLLLVLNFGGFCSILLLSYFLENESTRVRVLGGICTSLSVMVFIAPLSVMVRNLYIYTYTDDTYIYMKTNIYLFIIS